MVVTVLVPFKKTDEVNLEEFLARFIKEKYSEKIMVEHKDAVKSLGVLRKLAVCNHNSKVDPNFDLVAQYYFKLKKLEPILYCRDYQSFPNVPWFTTLVRSSFFYPSRFFSTDIMFEICNVLHLLGACAFSIGAKMSSSKDGDIKVAVKNFQLAAGIFEELKKNIQTYGYSNTVSDFNLDLVESLVNVALGQAQEGFLRKIISENGNDTQIARVSLACSTYFKVSSHYFESQDSKSSWEKDTEKIVVAKHLYYNAVSHFHQSNIDFDKRQYGVRIANLEVSKTRIAEAIKKISCPEFKSFSDKVNATLVQAIKENQMIYHAVVPNDSSICMTSALQVAKPIAPSMDAFFEEKNMPDVSDFHLIPIVVCNASLSFTRRLSQVINDQTGEICNADQTLDELMAELNIPACLENIGCRDIPPSLSEKANKVMANGGLRSIEANLKLLDDLRVRNIQILNEIRDSLYKEEATNSEMRKKHKERWSCTPSYEINRQWRESLAKFDEYLMSAMKADETLRTKFQSIRPHLDLLCQGQDKVAQLIAEKNSAIYKAGPEFRSKLVEKYREICSLKKRRQDLLSSISVKEGEVERHFMSRLNPNGSLKVEEECAQLVSKFDGVVDEIRKSINSQCDLVNFLIESAHKINSYASSHDNTLESLLKAYDTYFTVRLGIDEGVKFYNDLTQSLISQQTKINDFCCARSLETSELTEYLARSNAAVPIQSRTQNYSSLGPSYGVQIPDLPYHYQTYNRHQGQTSHFQVPSCPSTQSRPNFHQGGGPTYQY